MACDLTRFDLGATQHCRQGLRSASEGTSTMESAARAVCRYLYDELSGPAVERAAVMVRCYKTHAYGNLPADLQRYAKRALGTVAFTPPDAAMKCLVLLATVGDEPEWNDRRASQGHQAIPMPSPHIVERAPMIAQLMTELGFDIADVVRQPATSSSGADARTYGIFHVEEAAGSRYIPAQQGFVDRYAIRSVLGFGGALTNGEVGAVILFSRVHIPIAAAERFRMLALDLKTVLLSHADAVFDY